MGEQETAKCTEGPWEARENGDGGDFIICPVGFDTLIAEVPAEDVFADEARANANVLAAAWDMLAACEEALVVVDEAYEATGYIKIAKSSHQRMKIEAAILKAKGEAVPQ